MELVFSVVCDPLPGKDLSDDDYRPTDNFPHNISNDHLNLFSSMDHCQLV